MKFLEFAHVDIELINKLYDKFSEMPPLFVVQETPDRYTPEGIKIYLKKTGRKTVKGTQKLLDLKKGKKIFLDTPSIKWYLSHGLRLTAVHHLVEYEPGKPN